MPIYTYCMSESHQKYHTIILHKPSDQTRDMQLPSRTKIKTQKQNKTSGKTRNGKLDFSPASQHACRRHGLLCRDRDEKRNALLFTLNHPCICRQTYASCGNPWELSWHVPWHVSCLGGPCSLSVVPPCRAKHCLEFSADASYRAVPRSS